MNDDFGDRRFDPARLATDAAWLRRLAAQLVGVSDADDVVQATWLSAVERPPVLRSSARAWLAQVLRFKAARDFRSKDRRLRAEARAARPESDGASSPDVVVRAETARRLWTHVPALPEPARRAVLWRFFDGLDYAEIARRENISESAARVRSSRAVAELRRRLRAVDPDGGVPLWPFPRRRSSSRASSRASSSPSIVVAEIRVLMTTTVEPFAATIAGPALVGVVEDADGRPLHGAAVSALPWNLEPSAAFSANETWSR